MQPRMKNPAAVISQARQAIVALNAAADSGGVPATTLALVHLRASQINGCGACVDSGVRQGLKDGETPERLGAVAAWRDTSYFTDAERAALALTEAATRLADRSDPVPDEIWNEATEHYDELGMASLVLNVVTKQQAGAWG
jgi:AhpD family alkylhydroperoxidase